MRLRRAAARLDLRGALEHEIAQALLPARSAQPLTDESVHRIRKDLKRARAALRLLRDAVTKQAYVSENFLLRDAARPLAAARDATIVLQQLDELLASSRAKAYRGTLRRLRGELRRERKHLLGELQFNAAKGGIGEPLAEARGRVARWRLPRDTWSIVRPGLRRIYRRGRKALELARSSRSDRALHETRKQVKYLEAALEMLKPAKAPRVKKIAKSAAAVAKRLGDDHDIAVLEGMLRTKGADRALLAKLEPMRRKLQKKALKRARRLYKRKPKAFVARVERARAAPTSTA
jgi:CHAD domain-containing protein